MIEKKPTHDATLTTARERFKYCLDSQSLNRESQLDDLKFFAGSPDNGWQWDPKLLSVRQNDPNGARPCLTINKLPQHVRQITNEQRQNRPAIKVLPVDSKSDVEVADMLNGIVRHIEYQSDADTAYDTACESQVVIGEGYWRILTEYIDDTSLDQDIFIKAIPETFSVYLDPDRKDPAGADIRYGFIVKDFPEVDFKAEYPDADTINWDEVGRGDNYTNWFSSAEKKVKVAEYFYIEHETSRISVGGKDRVVRRPIVKWCKLTGTQVLDERVWPGKWIPIIIVIGNETWYEGNSYRSGIVRTTKDSQRLFNFGASAEAEQVGLANKAPYIGYAGQFEGHEDRWKRANIDNYPYLEVEAVDDGSGRPLGLPRREQPPQVSTALQAMKMSAADDIKSETGQYNPALGNNPKSQSGVALQREQAKSEITNFHYIDNLSRSIRHTGRQIVDLIPKVYDTKRIARILGADGTADQVMIDPSIPEPMQPMMDEAGKEIGKLYNPCLGKYDVAVVVGPSYTTQRQEAAQMLVELAQGATDPVVQISMRYLAVKNMDWSGAQEMADILKKLLPPGIADELDKGGGEMTPEEAKAFVMQAQEMVQQKEQAIRDAAEELAKEEERIAAEREALTQLESKTKQELSDFKHAQEIAKKDAEIVRKDIELKRKDLGAQQDAINRSTEETNAKADGVTASTQAIIEAIQESAKATAEAVIQAMGQMMQQSQEQLSELISCERRTELEFDDAGNPVASRSRMVPPQQPVTIQ